MFKGYIQKEEQREKGDLQCLRAAKQCIHDSVCQNAQYEGGNS